MERQVSNRYHLLEPLGEGGMGVVWRAYDQLLDRTVAIKEVRYSGVGDARLAELTRRTIREARAAGRLDHPSVIVIHDVVEEDGRPWIVMQLVPSRSLAEVIRESGPLRVGQVAVIGGRVLGALRAAHATGVLHRDVKPENVLLADDGRVVLTDFGIASLEAEAGLTATGNVVGTPAYMPPERLNGDPAGPESDLWSLGATLYAAVEGEPPFKRDSWAATVAAVLRDEPEPPMRAGALEPVIMGLLRRNPAARMPAEEAARLLYDAAGAPDRPATATGPAAPGRAGGTAEAPGLADGARTATGDRFPTGERRPTVTGRRERARTWWIAVPAAVIGLAVLGTAGVLLSDGWTATPTTGPATGPPGGEPPATPTPTPTTGPSTGPSTGPDPTRAPVPEGWRTYTSAAGRFSIALPRQWRAEKHATRDSVSFSRPGAAGTMMVEWTVPDIPWDDPREHWIGLEKEILAKKLFKGYERIRITPTRFLGLEAADWEFTRERDGLTIHVLNRGFHTRDGRPYALYWETTQSRWQRDRHYFAAFAKTFRPE
ncbi:serine/threonine-protein kinase [Nonomuraea diastatica]|uniref:non-specific serine/threonine protein kinase n=1 Tax=Nonomuraea diastatica TaxID=1848329 RepID=A0A4R4WNV1_9ACTN|nr:serine/threonine-protein kinase [Nonomuraea diastatica]TDD18483.1 serine/threonine protein kinase [Nonomuraea diastatica]